MGGAVAPKRRLLQAASVSYNQLLQGVWRKSLEGRLEMRKSHGCGLVGLLAIVVVSAATLVAPPAAGQRAAVPPSREAAQYSFASIVKKAVPAVVNVYVRGRGQVPASPFEEEFRRFFGERFGMPQERLLSSLGSGVIVSPDGIVVTNAHVIRTGANAEIRIVLADRREYDAKVVVPDEKSDIAVLKIVGGDGRFPYLEFADSDAAEVGDMVLAIGNPFGVGQTVTSGIVSALGRTQVAKAQVFIQTDAAINPGNSGGALVDMTGRVLGINTAIYSSSGGSHGIGFAIPSNLVRLIVDSAAAGRKLERPWLGARLSGVTRELAEQLKLGRVAGALVARVYDKSPAAEAGLLAGDVIVSVDGHEVDDEKAVGYRLTTRGIGNRARLDLVRDGRRMNVEVVLKAAPSGGRNDVRDVTGANPFDGARLASLGPSLADELGIADQESGVVVLGVRQGSTAARVGFRPGDVIVQVGRANIDTLADLETAVRERQRMWQVVFKRGGQLVRLQVSG
jgi:Do/DeqQ family serine protease